MGFLWSIERKSNKIVGINLFLNAEFLQNVLFLTSVSIKTCCFVLKNTFFLIFFVAYSCRFVRNPYLCIVFFIVLDLRLTRLGYSGIPFFMSWRRERGLTGCRFLIFALKACFGEYRQMPEGVYRLFYPMVMVDFPRNLLWGEWEKDRALFAKWK